MGLDNRDYARWRGDSWKPQVTNGRGGGFRGGGFRGRQGGFRDWDVWKQIIALNVAVFLLQIFITRPVTEKDFQKQPWMQDAYQELAYLDESVDPITGEPLADAAELTTEQTTDQKAERERLIAQQQREAFRQMSVYMPKVSLVQDWFQLDTRKVLDGQIWRLVTAGFCHDRSSIFHLLFNMLFLFWFGSRLEMRFGSIEFLAFYMTGLIASSLFFVGMDIATGSNVPAIGASGAVWAVLAVYALLYPYERIYLYFLFPIEIRFVAILYFLFDLHPVLLSLAGEDYESGVAHAAHVGGAIFGFFYWQQNWRLMPTYDNLWNRVSGLLIRPRSAGTGAKSGGGAAIPFPKRPSSGTDNRQADSSADDSSALDAILRKISEHGRESLTDEELETLEKTSRSIREKRQSDR